ncbi:MAG TPA: NAD(P)-binding domain-containing protein [Candidatus Dormibacteraeota bacterium]|nr:NAD(P)-binding domain-containing protein [Candidatus Dormibacteraeota bacterium]HEX2681903.1 NAD(P)-binding domain-containing protein [Candidatus Dormibacteraeota bacterium]
MVELTEAPFPPGRYPLVVVGSGPGALQLTYSLRALGVEHAVISADPTPGGMFRRWPIFQRMLSWTKPYADHERGTPAYERYDWNSLLADETENRAIMPTMMDGTSYFPSRHEMERGLVAFAERTDLQVRYGCRWESTGRDGEDFVLMTSDGEYRAPVVVFAVGIAQPWKPSVLDVEGVEQYGDLRPVETYANKRVFIVGKQNSGFEIASGLLPWARQIVLGSPSTTKLSVDTRTLVGVRARYVQPYEDWALAGGVVILDASIERVERVGSGYRVHTKSPTNGRILDFDVDDVIAATGFVSPLRDLPQLGVETFGQSRIPVQTPFWESATAPGVYFAGTIMQGAQGLKKHGIPSNSGAVQGYRYNARVLAAHLAEKHFGHPPQARGMKAAEVVPFLLQEASHGPELWHQRSYLARVVTIDADEGISDRGTQPLAHFVDSPGKDAVAVALEANGKDDPYPAIYLRARGPVKEHLLPSHPLLDFTGEEYQNDLASWLQPLLAGALTPSTQ